MLEKLVIIPYFASLATASQADLPTPANFLPQKSPLHAQPSENTSARDENLEMMLNIYRSLIFRQGAGKQTIEMAFGFYNGLIKESQNSNHLAEAYYNSGYILCCLIDPKNVDEGLKRLDEAYKIGNKDTKIRVLHAKFVLARDYDKSSEKNPNLRSPEHYVREMEKLDQNLAKELKKELKRFRESQKSK